MMCKFLIIPTIKLWNVPDLVKLLHNVNNVTFRFETNQVKVNLDQIQYLVFGKYDQADYFVNGDNLTIQYKILFKY